MEVRLDDQAAGCGATQCGGGFVSYAHDRNRRGGGVAPVTGPQDLDVAELVELLG
jgi:hypothetical protein